MQADIQGHSGPFRAIQVVPRWIIGATLAFAATLKFSADANISIWSWVVGQLPIEIQAGWWITILPLVVECTLAGLLVLRLNGRAGRVVTALVGLLFLLFTFLTLLTWWRGEGCGCFGGLPVGPHAMLAFDVSVCAMLSMDAWVPSLRYGWRAMLAALVAATWGMLLVDIAFRSYSESVGRQIAGLPIQLGLPVATYLEWDDDANSQIDVNLEDCVLAFVRWSCPRCRNELQQWLAAERSKSGVPVVLVETGGDTELVRMVFHKGGSPLVATWRGPHWSSTGLVLAEIREGRIRTIRQFAASTAGRVREADFLRSGGMELMVR